MGRELTASGEIEATTRHEAVPSSTPRSTLHAPQLTAHGPRPTIWLFLGLIGASVAALALAPWPLATKLYAVVHGLCAQRPSHSFTFDGVALPFDARMTGIYGGALTTALFLLASGRARAVRLPSVPIMAMLGLFVAIMGADGVNSTLLDLRAPYLYEPDNRLRLATGLLVGVTLGIMQAYLLNRTVWSDPADVPLLRGWRELGALLVAQALVYLLVISGWGALRTPLALALVVGAVAVVLTLALTFLVLAYGREGRFARPADLAGFASAALLLGYATLALIAAARFLLERFIDTSALM